MSKFIEGGYAPHIESHYGESLAKSGGPYIGKRGGKWADPQHTIPWDEKKHAGKPAPQAKKHDEHGARELTLHIDNTEHLANESTSSQNETQRGSIHKNLAKKIAAGTYDHAQAGKLFQHHVDNASKHYSKEYGGPAGGGHHFDAATRRAVARDMADNFHDEVKDGYHDHHVSSGVHAKRAKAGGGIAAMAERHSAKALHDRLSGKGRPVGGMASVASATKTAVKKSLIEGYAPRVNSIYKID